MALLVKGLDESYMRPVGLRHSGRITNQKWVHDHNPHFLAESHTGLSRHLPTLMCDNSHFYGNTSMGTKATGPVC